MILQDERALDMDMARVPNVSQDFLRALEGAGISGVGERVFYYVYGVLNSPEFRKRYSPLLRSDFPKIPIAPDSEAFRAAAEVGERLVKLHLLEEPALANHGIGFPVPGDHLVKTMRAADRYVPPSPDGKPGRVLLNDMEYFENVPPEAWEFRVGGYQPAHKWLDDRAGRNLTEEDITHYRRMIAAMRETVKLLPEADAAFLRIIGAGTEADADVA